MNDCRRLPQAAASGGTTRTSPAPWHLLGTRAGPHGRAQASAARPGTQEERTVAASSRNQARTAAAGKKPTMTGAGTSAAHPARIWDYWLGGKDNFATDREVADHVQEAMPVVREVARADRAFLACVVRHLAADCGIRQFLDIGTGLPTASNTHQVAQQAAPESRIVYVDNDPVVLSHARALLTSAPDGATAYVGADARDAGKILDAAAKTLDFSQPVAVLFLGILLFIPDADDPWAITAKVMDTAAPGSYLAISHGASDIQAEAAAAASERYNKHSVARMRLRTRPEFSRFFDGLELAAPGVVPINHWQPGPPPGPRLEAVLPAYAALARKHS
jgi:hypothetical protein